MKLLTSDALLWVQRGIRLMLKEVRFRSTRLTDGFMYRHEIHNYKEIKNEVCDGIMDFMNRHI